MAVDITAARDRYLELLHEGERKRLGGDHLGDYIARRLTAPELRALLLDYYNRNAQTPGGSNEQGR